jgi:hypothetical protein
MEKTAGGWNSIKMLQAFHDSAGARPTENREAGSAVLATAMLKPVSWTSSSVTLTTEQVSAALKAKPLTTSSPPNPIL